MIAYFSARAVRGAMGSADEVWQQNLLNIIEFLLLLTRFVEVSDAGLGVPWHFDFYERMVPPAVSSFVRI